MKQYYLGIEFGSTRVKAVLIDGEHRIVKSGDYTWKSSLENGVWTYHMEDVQDGLRTAIRNLGELPGAVSAMGISGMMHGYLAFDKDWNLLAPFRTWQNTMTGEAAEQLTAEFGFNIPQRWSIAHLYQAVLNGEAHVKNIAHITTLAGYVHYPCSYTHLTVPTNREVSISAVSVEWQKKAMGLSNTCDDAEDEEV